MGANGGMGRSEEAINAVAKICQQAGAAAYPVICDIAKTKTIEAAVNEAVGKLGGLNYLINCVGISARHSRFIQKSPLSLVQCMGWDMLPSDLSFDFQSGSTTHNLEHRIIMMSSR